MTDEEREVFVDTRYPIPSFVDGIVYVVPDEDVEEQEWDEVDVDSEFLSDEESEESNDEVQTPEPISIEDQVVSYALGGAGVVNAVVMIQDIPFIDDYEIRVVPR